MTIQTVEKRLDEVLAEAMDAAYEAGRGVKGAKLAREIYLSQPELMEMLKEPWMVERLAWQINRKRAERWRAESSQLALPGFEEMPLRIFLRNGQRPRLEFATMSQVEDHVKLLRTRFKNSPRLRKMEAVLDLMRRYAEDKDAFGQKASTMALLYAAARRYAEDKDAFGATWADVKRKELERRDFERLVGA